MSLLDIRSRRLRAGPWADLRQADLAALFAPDVVRWLPDGFQGHDEDPSRRDFLRTLASEAEVAALFDAQGAGIGLLILSHSQRGTPERHLGYLLVESVWGQGLASELLAALQHHFQGSDVILSGGVMAENSASARVLEKAGFSRQLRGDELVFRWSASAAAGGEPEQSPEI